MGEGWVAQGNHCPARPWVAWQVGDQPHTWGYDWGGGHAMKKSASVSLTVVAAFGIAAQAQPRLDPCAAASFNEQACQAAVQNRGYCWNGQWVKLKYHYAYPYYYDAYQAYM